ncbi:winged helix DNA-binding domain-containing protein [Propionibacteriaceae bacterium G1746]
MPDPSLGRARLVAQGLLTRPFTTPSDAVRAHVAMQGQDLPGVMASAALRTAGGTVEAVIEALDSGELVRGYPMRGTVFLMAADDVAWVTELASGWMLRAQAARRGQLGLTADLVEQASEVAQQVLVGTERGLPRTELFAHWQAVGVPTTGGAGYHVLSHLIGRGELVHGPWNGTDQNVVATAQWLPRGNDVELRFNGDVTAATAEFLLRYLTSHGPATVRDFAWWTKLPLKQVRAGLALVRDQLEASDEDEPAYWRAGLADEVDALGDEVGRPLLLPGFDEFILGYQDRLFAMAELEHDLLVPGNNGVFRRTAVRDGQVLGTWSRGGRPGKRTFELVLFEGVRVTKKLAGAYERLYRDFPWVVD